jgi:hypothetical protein
MHNPIRPEPKYALWPSPPGCTGHRILQFLRRQLPDVTEEQYLETFDRRNLLYETTWDRERARPGAAALQRELEGTRRSVLVLGEEARRLLGLPKRDVEIRAHGCRWWLLPHPSGRCRWYNADFCKDVASLILQMMYEEYHSCM